ncbi:hypothetical protein BHE74_00033445 [Ensete ventricosum]|nr:hypothetical protein GW17_00038104 [Ensete ventricosum]RWW59666.1 hypothetical protein BHE74_00033445 [Ensete ventricosum]
MMAVVNYGFGGGEAQPKTTQEQHQQEKARDAVGTQHVHGGKQEEKEACNTWRLCRRTSLQWLLAILYPIPQLGRNCATSKRFFFFFRFGRFSASSAPDGGKEAAPSDLMASNDRRRNPTPRLTGARCFNSAAAIASIARAIDR